MARCIILLEYPIIVGNKTLATTSGRRRNIKSRKVENHSIPEPCSPQPSSSEAHSQSNEVEDVGTRHNGAGKAAFIIRKAKPNDCPEILQMIKQLADCQKMPNAVELTETDLLEDGFGARPYYHCLIAELQGTTEGSAKVGFAMYYFTYDPWTGRSLHLEEFFVMEPYRGLGIGSEILQKISQVAIAHRCSSMYFLVLSWNMAAIEYYKKRGAANLSEEDGWHLFRFSQDDLKWMAEGPGASNQ
ncbi:spermidine/spermine N(1)-acetyltransferase-like protein 1 [Eleutherodactylus coqui]|uniref:spermidine/spermine N(1)-acetyltransferase-like protein 1 n=1 Tax=Eleutherodactylus coqui TaxID=57060 RepID=UPI0034636678